MTPFAVNDPTDDQRPEPTPSTTEDRLRASATDLVHAARSMLDVIEEMINDQETTNGLLRELKNFGNALAGRHSDTSTDTTSSGSRLQRVELDDEDEEDFS